MEKEREEGDLASFFHSVRLREMLLASAISEKEIEKIDMELRKIPKTGSLEE